jgi:hypothetical protein
LYLKDGFGKPSFLRAADMIRMKYKITIPAMFSLFLMSALGCGLIERAENNNKAANQTNANGGAANKTLTDTAIETAVGGEKIGVPECDELLERLAQISESPDDSYVTKAARQFALSKIRENVRRSFEENKNDKTKMAKDCREYRAQLDKYKTQESSDKQ